MQNEEDVKMLISMMGNDLDADVARRVLAKHNNDIQTAADAILGGDRGEEIPTAWESTDPFESSTSMSGALNVPRRPNTPHTPERNAHGGKDVIDLTAETDPDLSRALQMSLEQTQSEGQNESTFRPSDRAPDPNWAMVPSNVPTTTVQEQEDQSLSRAIEASLSTSYIEDKYEDLPDEERVRKPGYPLALRTGYNGHYFVTLVLQALFHVPQIRQRIALWRWTENESGRQPSPDSPEYLPYAISTIFTYTDLALPSYISIDGLSVVANYKGRLATTASDLPGELSNEFYSYIARSIEDQLRVDNSQGWERLFHLRYAPIDSRSPPTSLATDANAPGIESAQLAPSKGGSETACVRVDLRGPNKPNDLLSCLSSQLGLATPLSTDAGIKSAFNSPPQALIAPSDVIAFELIRSAQSLGQVQAQQSSTTSTPFRYPSHVYLDQFLLQNATLASDKRTLKRDMEQQLQELTSKKGALTQFEGKDTRKSLSSALYYFENVAAKDNSPSRAEDVKSAATRLQKIISNMNNKIQTLDAQISNLQEKIAKVFDDPSLRRHRYDLRAVLVHDGLFGRSHVHSFVQHGGRWWKCQDAAVAEVSEEVVLTDTTGLHLGAGPYMLIYSRETDEVDLKSRWPTFLKNNAKADNENYLRVLDGIAPDTAANLRSTYTPSPIVRAASMPGSFPEDEGGASRRSMSAMSIVDEDAEEKKDEIVVA